MLCPSVKVGVVETKGRPDGRLAQTQPGRARPGLSVGVCPAVEVISA